MYSDSKTDLIPTVVLYSKHDLLIWLFSDYEEPLDRAMNEIPQEFVEMISQSGKTRRDWFSMKFFWVSKCILSTKVDD